MSHTVRRWRQTTIGESPNMLETARHVARSKGVMVTAIPEAGRQRETWITRWIRYPDAKRQAETNSETRCSIVRQSRSNADNGCAEALVWCRRQHMVFGNAAGIPWHPGVAGSACRESCLREDVRSRIFIHEEIKRPDAVSTEDVMMPISETREMASEEIREVGRENSSDERSVMDKDAKVPCFEQVPAEFKTTPYSPGGVSHGR